MIEIATGSDNVQSYNLPGSCNRNVKLNHEEPQKKNEKSLSMIAPFKKNQPHSAQMGVVAHSIHKCCCSQSTDRETTQT
jgi:hypothetical protein